MIKIGGLQKLTLIDYPGRLAATVFILGCNFRCSFCYSAELVLPEKIGLQPRISQKEFFEFLKKRKGFLEGVCLTGGEPILNRGLPGFIKKIKEMGFLVKLDTNGSEPERLGNLIKANLIDYLAMDIKAPLGLNFKFARLRRGFGRQAIGNRRSCLQGRGPAHMNMDCGFQSNSKCQIPKYEKTTGVKIDLNKIKKSIEIIKNSGLDYEFRTTVVPGIHTKDDIFQIAREISPAKKYFLQNFRPEKTIDPRFEKAKPYPRESLLKIQKAISPFFEVCQVR